MFQFQDLGIVHTFSLAWLSGTLEFHRININSVIPAFTSKNVGCESKILLFSVYVTQFVMLVVLVQVKTRGDC